MVLLRPLGDVVAVGLGLRLLVAQLYLQLLYLCPEPLVLLCQLLELLVGVAGDAQPGAALAHLPPANVCLPTVVAALMLLWQLIYLS